jgi:hypothetical protein
MLPLAHRVDEWSLLDHGVAKGWRLDLRVLFWYGFYWRIGWYPGGIFMDYDDT